MRKIISYKVYIPENIDLDNLLKQNPLNIPNAKDYIAVLMDKIHSSIATKKDVDLEAQKGFTKLYSKILKQWCDSYSDVMDWLIVNGIVECNDSYSNNSKSAFSKGYKFAEAYQVKLKGYNVTTGTLVKKLNGTKKLKRLKSPILKSSHLKNIYPDVIEDCSYSKIAEDKLSFLKTYFNKDLEIDSEKSEQFLNSILIKDLENKSKQSPFTNYNIRKMNLDKFSNGQYHFHIDDTSGRLHTILTNLKSDLKNLITYKGKTLSSIDLKNSQPLLSITFLDTELYILNKMEDRIKIYDNEKSIISPSHYTMLWDLIQERQNLPDVVHYKQLVKDGKIYEFFAEKMIAKGMIAYNISEKQQRKEAKNIMFTALFAQNKSINNKHIGKYIRLFQGCFPNVLEIFFRVKQITHKSLSCSLQNLESEVFLHRIAVNIHIQFPEIPKYTIHDSIATFSSNIEDIKPIVEDELKSVLGFIPKLTIEHWNRDIFSDDLNTNCYYGFADDDVSTFSIKQVAEQLGIGKNKLLKQLRDIEILQNDENNWNIPMDEYIINGHFLIKKKKIKNNTEVPILLVSNSGIDLIKSLIN